MIYIVENIIAIALATAASLVVTAVRSRKVLRPATLPLTVLSLGWMASIMAGALIVAPEQAGAWTMAIGTAVIIWIGFVVPVLAIDHRRHALSVKTTLVDSLHWLAIALVQVVVLSVWGLPKLPT